MNEDKKQIEKKNKPQDNKLLSHKNNTKKQSGVFISVLALVVALCLSSYVIYDKCLEQSEQNEKESQLLNKLTQLKTDLMELQTQNQDLNAKSNEILTKQVAEQLQQIQEIQTKANLAAKNEQKLQTDRDAELEEMNRQISHLTESVQSVNRTDNQWMIAQANYLVNLASRKIWSDKDYKTAYSLLKNADATLAQMNDQQIIPARKAINEDLNQISAHSFIDYDGLILNLMRLSDVVDQLPLIAGYKNMNVEFHDDSFSELEPITSSLDDWKANLEVSVDHFFAKFIKISKINETNSIDQCLSDAQNDPAQIEACQAYKDALPPEQATYLRENIRLRLLIAAQAVSRHQNEIYQTALQNVNEWVNAYFATESSSVVDFLTELNQLISVNIEANQSDETLKSLAVLDSMMKQKK